MKTIAKTLFAGLVSLVFSSGYRARVREPWCQVGEVDPI